MLVTVVLFGVILIATATDVARRKIYNWTTYGGTLLALGLSALGSLAAVAGAGEGQLRSLGWIPLADSLFGLLACGVVMLVSFAMFSIGGGDVKLIAMVGAFLGPEQGITAMLWTFVFGACMGVVVLIWRFGPIGLLMRTLRQLICLLRIARGVR